MSQETVYEQLERLVEDLKKAQDDVLGTDSEYMDKEILTEVKVRAAEMVNASDIVMERIEEE